MGYRGNRCLQFHPQFLHCLRLVISRSTPRAHVSSSHWIFYQNETNLETSPCSLWGLVIHLFQQDPKGQRQTWNLRNITTLNKGVQSVHLLFLFSYGKPFIIVITTNKWQSDWNFISSSNVKRKFLRLIQSKGQEIPEKKTIKRVEFMILSCITITG